MKVLLRINAGWILWAAGFAVLYGVHGIGCAERAAWTRLAVISVYAALLIGHALLLVRVWGSRNDHRVDRIASWSAVASGAATMITGSPALLSAQCI